MTSRHVPHPARGLRAIAAAQDTLPATRRAQLDDGTVEYLLAGEGAPAVALLSGLGVAAAGLGAGRRRARPGHDGLRPQPPRTRREQRAAPAADRDGDRRRAARDARRGRPRAALRRRRPCARRPVRNLYARLYPHEIAGVVLLEATHPDDEPLERHFRFLPRPLTRVLMATAVAERGRNAELRQLAQTTREIAAAGPFPAVPLAVVSGAKRPSKWAMATARVATHAARQWQLVSLSPLGRQVIAPASGISRRLGPRRRR